MLKLTVPKPCHEDWNAMTPNQQGRHCDSCAKTVVDFTQLSDDEVKNFFLNKKDERVCGRFNNSQLHRISIQLPQNILEIQMPFWKRFLAACLIVFSTTLFSCDTNVTNPPVMGSQIEMPGKPTCDSTSGFPGPAIDTSLYPRIERTVGIIAIPDIKYDTVVEEVLQGDVALEIPNIQNQIVGEPALIPEARAIKRDSSVKQEILKTDTANCGALNYF